MRFPARLSGAVVATVAAASVALSTSSFAAPAPTPAPTPSAPSAKAPAPSPAAAGLAAQAKALKALAADLRKAQLTLKPLQAAATAATKSWRQTRAKLTVARAVQARADAAAAAARAAEDAQSAQVDLLAASAYKSGGAPPWMTALNVTNPTDLFTQQATLNQVAQAQNAQLAQLAVLQVTAGAAAQTAHDAAAQVFALEDQARRAQVSASAAMAAQQKLVHGLMTRQAQISNAVQRLLATTPPAQRAALLHQLADAVKAVNATAADVDASMRAVTSLLPMATARQGLAALAWAKKQLGEPYSWGGGNETGPTLGMINPDGNKAGLTTIGFDCSGLALFVWAKEGFALDHFTGYQWFEGRTVARADLRPGDLVFFATDVKDPATIHHVGIYAGNGRMIDAPHTGAKVRYDNVFNAQYVGAVRP